MSEAKILFIGPGAIGASVAALVAENYPAVFIMGHGETQAALRKDGITTYQSAAPEQTRRTVHVATVDRPRDIGSVDIVVLAVKNYSLEAVAQQVRDELGDRPIVVSMANGIDNQRILPKFFSKVIYCVVAYNAWRDGPAVIGYQRKGPLLIGTPDNSLGAELQLVQSILSRGCPTQIVDRLQDAVHTKIVINLTNALDALVGRGWRPLSNLAVYQQLLTQTLWEGVRIIRAAGYHEYQHRRTAALQLSAVGDAAAGLRSSPGVQAQARRHGDVEHDSGCGAARRPRHRTGIDHRLYRAACRRAWRGGSVQPGDLPAGPRKIPSRLSADALRGGAGRG